jgi:hypothetical protein
MTTEERQARYVKQKKTALRLEHGRHRTPANRPSGERAIKGRKRGYADWMRKQYSQWLRGARRQNSKAKLGRYTPGQGR